MMAWVRSQLLPLGLAPREARRIELSLEEAFMNVIRHAYPSSVQGSLALSCHRELGQFIAFTLMDEGQPFNPLDHIGPLKTPQTLQETKEGGLGIVLMAKMMDHIEYERRGTYNVLTLRKMLPNARIS